MIHHVLERKSLTNLVSDRKAILFFSNILIQRKLRFFLKNNFINLEKLHSKNSNFKFKVFAISFITIFPKQFTTTSQICITFIAFSTSYEILIFEIACLLTVASSFLYNRCVRFCLFLRQTHLLE